MGTVSSSIEHRIGDAFVTIDVNESNNPGHGSRECIWRVRRGRIVSVYRCRISDAELPGKIPWETAGYLVTQSHRRNLLWAYQDPGPHKP